MSARRPHAKPATRAELEQRAADLRRKADAIIFGGSGSVPEGRRLDKLEDDLTAVRKQLAAMLDPEPDQDDERDEAADLRFDLAEGK